MGFSVVLVDGHTRHYFGLVLSLHLLLLVWTLLHTLSVVHVEGVGRIIVISHDFEILN